MLQYLNGNKAIIIFCVFIFLGGCSGASDTISPNDNSPSTPSTPSTTPSTGSTPTPVTVPQPTPEVEPEPTPKPETVWKDCANQNEYCFYEGTTTVRFGVEGKWLEREFQGEVYCDTDSFSGDPAIGELKTCQVQQNVLVITDPPLYWHHPATWPNGIVPADGSHVTIAQGKKILLDRPISVNGLTINGELTCLDRDLTIDAFWIMVHGRLTCGSAQSPYLHHLTITLFGQPDSPNVMDMGNKFIGAMGAGELHLHGNPSATSWIKLNATAQAGDTLITLNVAPAWSAGDEIVLSSTSENMNEAEIHTIESVNGVFVSLTKPLAFSHFGQQQPFDNGKGQSWLADTRAEVALLSRNITVQGDASSSNTQHGGHIMAMGGSKAFISGVTLKNMGQLGLLGRYPFHWHLAGDVTGQYIKNSSIYNSYNRCVTIHQTDHALVQNNVCYNHIGHGYFLEDGVERFNTIDSNISINAVRPDPEVAILESDHRFNRAGGGPSNFWITHPTNTVTNNVAAGGDGTGFWYFLQDTVQTSVFGFKTRPSDADYLAFHNNTSHSVSVGYSSCRFGNVFGWESDDIVIHNMLVHSARDSGIWPCSGATQRFENLMVLDTGRHGDKAAFTAPNGMTINNSLFVANSALSDLHSSAVGRTAYGHYDQGSLVKNTLFVNYTKQQNSGLMGLVGGAVKRSKNRMENVAFVPKHFDPFAVQPDFNSRQTVIMMTVMHDDENGSLTDFPNQAIVPWHTVYEGIDSCKRFVDVFDSGHGAAVCDLRIIRARIQGISSAVGNKYTFFRRNPDNSLVAHESAQLPFFKFIQSFTVVNQDYHFGVEFNVQPSEPFHILFDDAWPDDVFTYELKNIGSAVSRVRDYRLVNSLDEFQAANDDVYMFSENTIRLKGHITGVQRWTSGNKVYID